MLLYWASTELTSTPGGTGSTGGSTPTGGTIL